MSFANTGKLPGLPEPTPAQQHKIQIVTGTVANMIRDSNCGDLEAKAVISNLLLEFGSLEQYSEDQRIAMKTNYKQKRYTKANNWRVR